ncbi:HutD family protein [Frondihabitans australicus]|uniref:HutD protein n=1 Tax=Frondihabitans australicus TaxID=386892 RepID=A0A495IEK2_9MICO|nr:HutD family protein [Frondihabitans australicus]RKR73565.1 HutD protein [Frondihabitans australicus]
MIDPAPRILPALGREWQPWANGGGVSSTFVEGPDFRIALAVIDREGPFSDYSGFDRTLLHAGGPPLTLVVDGVPHALSVGRQLTFDGAAAVSAVGVSGPVQAFNLMVRRGVVSGSLSVSRTDVVEAGAGSETALVLLLTPATLADGRPLAPHDAVLPSRAPLVLAAPADVAVVRAAPVALA